MFEMQSREQIDEIIQRARFERARVMQQGLSWVGRKLASPFRAVLNRSEPRNSHS
ncbi:MAG: hypothetical protein AAGA70_03270 [Pseudomonadota bacterium]